MSSRTQTKDSKPGKTERRKTQVLNIRIPKELILEIDAVVKNKTYKSRSEAIREFARKYVRAQSQAQKQKNAKSEREGEGW